MKACLTHFQSEGFLQSIGLDTYTQQIVSTALSNVPAGDFESEIRNQLETYDQMINFLQEVLQDHQHQIEEAQATMGQLQTLLDQVQVKAKRLEKEAAEEARKEAERKAAEEAEEARRAAEAAEAKKMEEEAAEEARKEAERKAAEEAEEARKKKKGSQKGKGGEARGERSSRVQAFAFLGEFKPGGSNFNGAYDEEIEIDNWKNAQREMGSLVSQVAGEQRD